METDPLIICRAANTALRKMNARMERKVIMLRAKNTRLNTDNQSLRQQLNDIEHRAQFGAEP